MFKNGMSVQIISGPTYDNQPSFKWSEFPDKTVKHFGMVLLLLLF